MVGRNALLFRSRKNILWPLHYPPSGFSRNREGLKLSGFSKRSSSWNTAPIVFKFSSLKICLLKRRLTFILEYNCSFLDKLVTVLYWVWSECVYIANLIGLIPEHLLLQHEGRKVEQQVEVDGSIIPSEQRKAKIVYYQPHWWLPVHKEAFQYRLSQASYLGRSCYRFLVELFVVPLNPDASVKRGTRIEWKSKSCQVPPQSSQRRNSWKNIDWDNIGLQRNTTYRTFLRSEFHSFALAETVSIWQAFPSPRTMRRSTWSSKRVYSFRCMLQTSLQIVFHDPNRSGTFFRIGIRSMGGWDIGQEVNPLFLHLPVCHSDESCDTIAVHDWHYDGVCIAPNILTEVLKTFSPT